MARPPKLILSPAARAILRFAEPETGELKTLVFRRYPDKEWATFALFGWRPHSDDIVLTLASLAPPREGELDESVGHVAIAEPYTLRVALAAEHHSLAVGVIHSHPNEYVPRASSVDDDMDSYYSNYFDSFTAGRPYISLILTKLNGQTVLSGRVFWKGKWLAIEHVSAERLPIQTWLEQNRDQGSAKRERTARLRAAFGEQAAELLRASTAAVIGVGGTGSAAVEVLARAGVGRLIVIDPDHLEPSNLERIHGSTPKHAEDHAAKVIVARDHVTSIDPSIKVEAFVGRLPQGLVLDSLVTADVVIGCTDQQYSRLALSDLALRYLVPAIDCGVTLEGENGVVTGQIAQIVRFLAADPCALCRGMIAPGTIAQELMSDAERAQRQRAANEAAARGEDPHPYWRDEQQLNTVGYLTTMAGALAAGYAIGWLTGRFDVPFSRVQLNLVEKLLGVVEPVDVPRPECVCRKVRGQADQAIADCLITAPDHWPAAHRV
jgi:hypothetical protein